MALPGAGAGRSEGLVANARSRQAHRALGGWPDWAARAGGARQDVEQAPSRQGRRVGAYPEHDVRSGHLVRRSRARPPVGTMALVPLAGTKGTRAFLVDHS